MEGHQPRTTSRSSLFSDSKNARGIENLISRVLRDIKADFSDKGEEFNSNDLEKLVTTPPPTTPPFPFLILSLAILKDFLDGLANLTVILVIGTTILGFAVGLAIAIWMFGKLSGGWWKKAMMRWIWIRLGLAITIEIIPFVQVIPANTIIVLMAHYKEVKIVRLFNRALERLHSTGAINHLR